MKKRTFDRSLLEQYWCKENLTLKEISTKLQASEKTIHKAIKEASLIRNYMNKDWLYDLHVNKKLNCKQIAKEAHCSVDTIYDWMKRHGIEVVDSVTHLVKKKYTENETFFSIIDTEEKAYWLGFIMADGHVDDYKLTISLSKKDKSHLQKLVQAIKSNRTIREYDTYLTSTEKSYKMVRLDINSKKIVNDLNSLGLTKNKSLNEFIPDIPQNLIRHFIRGYFDGDGCITGGFKKSGETWVAFNVVGGLSILEQITSVLNEELGITLNIHNKENGLKVIIGSDGVALTIFDWMYKDAHVYLSRKFLKYHSLEDIVRPSCESMRVKQK